MGMTGWTWTSVLLGAIVWLGILVLPLSVGNLLETIARLLLLALLVFAPLGLSLAQTPDRAGRHPLPYRLARFVQPFAAVLAAVSFFLPAGVPAAILASAWLACTGLIALFGLARFLPRGFARADEVCIDAGLIYLPVGAAWLVIARLGANPLGFGEVIVLLTAIHFHYTGFAAPILAGMVGRALSDVRPSAWSVYRLAAAGLVAGTPLIAVGITLSPIVEVVSVLAVVTSLVFLSGLTAFVIAPAIRLRTPQAFLLISSGSLAAAMLAAGIYGIGQFTGTEALSIPQMIIVHGWVNAIGFVLCGLVAWTILRPPSKIEAR